MPETIAPENIARLAASAQRRVVAILAKLFKVIAVLAGIGLIAFLCREGLIRYGPDAAWMLVQVPLSICTVGLAWRFGARHEQSWVRPARQLLRLAEEARNSQTPIESLQQVHGPIAPLARFIQDILHDLRCEQKSKARLNAEISQRIRHRTDHLERKLASWQTQAYRDSLTGLYNKRLLDEQLPKLLEQAKADQQPMAVLALDMDNFKQVNDTLGHAAGDRLLRDIGQIIQSTVREQDMAFRTGGDEFLIIMPENDARAGLQLGRRIVALVDQLAATVHSEPKPGISIGVIGLVDHRTIRPADVLRQADAAMYQIKSARKARR